MESGQPVEAHLPDPGRLSDILLPGRKVWLRPTSDRSRKTLWSAVLAETDEGTGLVSIDTTVPNRLVQKALQARAMEEFNGWSLAETEFRRGASRWDFLLTHSSGKKLILEVKSVTLVKNRVGLFPDAVTVRGSKHVSELSSVAREAGWEAALLFMAQREDVQRIAAAKTIDPRFAQALAEAERSGVRLLARKCVVSLEGITLSEAIPVFP
ncbi:DNA/RNA nuclease SfsA [Bacillaceae bacterium]